ncbi:hypothetical protein UAY_01624 [Enterococcus moraviensis ATCC BAA-383]|uniref:DUF1576 domain-containing protein n=1 Tax=Enterococcus moraviensis ATCC BAA-383 TaxID=1158609 RepID=R2QYQ7_9ENTE|nr:DUF1576 domain-containing protein [Enterococcus moraviensis]EOI00521.1 hypothetical protein UAY_01624 [Enterococcus moraviensis ATCC BAA-383]EOT73250.1 hypothetical protein I586_00243 [Enterococcus moraviensis ATCC BAA-383]OJG68806.1 hypothetical protein RV09_GL000205 [Enterococcus moraviensis]
MAKNNSQKLLLHTNKKQFEVNDKSKNYYFLISYCLLLIIIGVFSEPLSSLYSGMFRILTSPSNLLTDYIELGTFGSAFVNSGLLTLISVLLAKKEKIPINGPMIAALFTVSGCSFFGKNLYNSIPIIIGGLLYARIVKKPFSQFIVVSLFGSALSPIISYLTFGISLPLLFSIPLGCFVGIFIGLILPALASHVLTFHQGFSLYNVGFTSGLIAMLFTGILRMFGWKIEGKNVVSTAYHSKLLVFLLFLFAVMFIVGFVVNHFSIKGLKEISKTSGKLITDFISISGVGATIMNMALMGLLLLGYTQVSQATLNGPIVGAILSAVGFSAFGNHILNSFPLLLSVFLTAYLSSVFEVNQTTVVLAGIFGTGLAPIAGYYGLTFGLVAGFLHMSLVTNVSYLHGGLNLYNNGFSTGFVAAVMVPLLDNILQIRKVKQHARKRQS